MSERGATGIGQRGLEPKRTKIEGLLNSQVTSALEQILSITFQYTVFPEVLETNVTGTGAAAIPSAPPKSVLRLNTGATTGSSASATGKQLIDFNDSLSTYFAFTCSFDEPTADTTQLVGFGNSVEGFFFGYVGLDFGIISRRAGVDTFLNRDDFNQNPFRGASQLLNPQGFNTYLFRYKPIEFGACDCFVRCRCADGNFELVHKFTQVGTSQPALALPNIPFYCEVDNGTTTDDKQMEVHSVYAYAEGGSAGGGDGGGDEPGGVGQAPRLFSVAQYRVVPNNGNWSILTIRAKSLFQGLDNRVTLKLTQMHLANQRSGEAFVSLVQNPTNTFAPWSDVDASFSSVEVTTDTEQITDGTTVFTTFLKQEYNYTLDLNPFGIIMTKDDVFTVAFQREQNNTSAEVFVSLAWEEVL